MEHLSNDHKECPNQLEHSHKLYDETGHHILSSKESQWKLRQENDQNFPLEANASVRRKKEIKKSRTVRVTVRDPSRKVNHLSKVD